MPKDLKNIKKIAVYFYFSFFVTMFFTMQPAQAQDSTVSDSTLQKVHHQATKILLDYLTTEDAGIQAIKQNRLIAAEGIISAESSNDTVVTANFNAQKSLSDIDQKSGSGQRIHSTAHDHDLAASLNLTKTVMDWGLQDSKVTQAEFALILGEEDIRNQTESTYLAALNAYYATLRVMSRLEVRRANVHNLQSKLAESQSRFNAGVNNTTQLAIAQAALALGESNLAQEKAQLESTLNDLRVYAPEGFEKNIPSRIVFPEPNKSVMEINLEDALQQQKDNSPAIIRTIQAINQAKAQLAVLRKTNGPTLAVNLNATRSHGNGTTNSRNNNASAAVTFKLPILNKGVDVSNIRAQQLRVSQAQMQHRATLDQQSALLKRSWTDFHALSTNMVAGKQNVAARQSLLDRAQSALKVGQYTASQVLDEEEKLLEAELSVIDTQYQQLIKGFEVTKLIGWPLSENL